MAFSSISDLWNQWNTRGFVILSLSLQVFLILFAPARKKTTYTPIVFLLWLAYLAADWVAPFAIGLITHHQGNSSARVAEVDGALQAFWASFLLLHLGGQDTITAFSMEDNWLWRRHLLTLIFQVGAAIYVFVQLIPSDKSLVIPTMLVFVAAIIKNVERTLALHHSSLPKLKESIFKEHKYFHAADNKLSEELRVLRHRRLMVGVPFSESLVVKHAYLFFQIFKVFLADLLFTSRQREISRNYFHLVSAEDALRVISVELHFMYEVLHTKALVIHSKWSYIFRFIAFTDMVVAFMLFNRFKNDELPKLDVKITYILLFGGIALDVIALLILIFSDWTIAKIKCYSHESAREDSFLPTLIATIDYWTPQFTSVKRLGANDSYMVLNTPAILRRWSESIFACNLLSVSLKKCPRMMFVSGWHWGIIMFFYICNFPCRMADRIIPHFHQACERIARGWCLSNAGEKIPMIGNTKYVSKNPLIVELWSFIFSEVKRKSENAHTFEQVKYIFDARGDQFLQTIVRRGDDICSNLLQYVTEVNYDASIIMWHLATEICYNREQRTARNEAREFSKILSDYMFYLLLNQPDVVSTVAGIAQMRSAETLRLLSDPPPSEGLNLETLCNELFELSLTGPISESQLGQGIRLARKLEGLGQIKWEVMSGVWAEMLSYAAIHIKGEVHVQVLSKGGELLAFVWLLMAHFGCLYKPEMGICYENWYERPADVISSPRSNPRIELATIP